MPDFVAPVPKFGASGKPNRAVTELLDWIKGVLRRPVSDLRCLRLLFYPLRTLSIIVAALPLAYVATFRTFGFDAEDTFINYPKDVASGWGVWAWLAQHFEYSVFFFAVNFVLAILILSLTFPRKRDGYSWYWPVQVAGFFFMVLWFLFGQARYGSAINLVVCALSAGSILWAVMLFALSFLTHKAAAGGIALVLAWLVLRRKSYGIWVAASICLAASLVITRLAVYLLVISNYANYLGWADEYAPAATPYKYVCIGLLLLGWYCVAKRVEEKATAKEMLVLTLLFFPSSLYIISAGRGYEFYAVVVLALLSKKIVPSFVRYPILLLYLVDIVHLAFFSPLYRPFGGA